ncbi:MAG: tetratricopeptide repeat protein [Deltaproteobacteria bacterium]|nr:MAG: tetratricopeptide repeat protein [Deltaproteobacteria bacterium]
MNGLGSIRWAGVVAAALCAFAQTARAQSDNPPAGAAPASAQAIVLPQEKSADLNAHWALRREYLRDRDDRRAEDEERKVRQIKDDLALTNLFAIGAALVRESHDALAADSPALALKLCNLAVELAPDLRDAHTCVARAALADDPTSVRVAASETIAAARAAISDPRESRAFLANTGSVIFAGVLAAAAAFVLLLFLRYGRFYAHDVFHLFPTGARRWQTAVLAAALIAAPLLLRLGVAPVFFAILIACALYATTAEVVVSLVLLACVAAAPTAAAALARLAAFGGPASDAYLVEHGEGTPPQIARLAARLSRGKPEMPVAFVLAHKAKREGDLAEAEALYEKAIEAAPPDTSNRALAVLHNDLGNVYFLAHDAQKAEREYQQAIELAEGLAAPHFNLSRALGDRGTSGLEKVQSEQARALELDRVAVEEFTGGQLGANRKANKLVMDLPLDPSMLDGLLDSEARVAGPISDEARILLGGRNAQAVAIATAILLLLLHILRSRVRPSSRCERCGREVCKRCDADARPAEALCAQCVNVFVRRTGVDPAERARKQTSVDRYHRRRTVLVRLSNVLSGAGHVLLGYPVRGLLFLLVTGCLLMSVLLFHGLAHAPNPVRSGLSMFRVGMTVAAFLLTYGICFRDIGTRDRTEAP